MEESASRWHSITAEDAVLKLKSSRESGLTSADAEARLKSYGENRLPEKDRASVLMMLAAQVKNVMILLLAIAAVFAFVTGQTLDTVAIIAVIAANTALGFVIEFRAEKASQALKRLFVTSCRTVRDGQMVNLPTLNIVPGDIIVLEAGFRVLADARVIESANLSVDESALTGESMPVEKNPDALFANGTVVADRLNMVYTGTLVVRGMGRAVVVSTGRDTEMAKISTLLVESKTETTPLQKRINYLMRYVLFLVGIIAATVTFAGILRGEPVFPMVETGIAITVAAVPEGMPAVITISLAIGVRRMAARNSIIRRLSAVESLGSVDIICSDKTGTMTVNQMTVRAIGCCDGTAAVGGAGYEPSGKVEFVQGRETAPDGSWGLRLSLAAGMLCNNSSLGFINNEWKGTGDPTEIALITLGIKGGIDQASLRADFPRFREIEFRASTRMMATIHPAHELPKYAPTMHFTKGVVCFVKGSPEAVLQASSHFIRGDASRQMTVEQKEGLLDENMKMAGKGLRVLATAFRLMDSIDEDPYSGLTFLSLVGMEDPPREEVRASVDRCREAGVRVIMITGDQPATGQRIAADLGLGSSGDQITVTDGRTLSSLKGKDFDDAVGSTDVFARVSPEQKLGIVTALKSSGKTVAMTGDGINDAPALEAADIGISMGKGGTDVAREASDVILVDDNFSSIVAAVEEGRIAFSNIRKFVSYLFSCNFSELFIMLVAILAGLPLPLLALQILWLNLVTDTLPAMSLISERASEDIMRKPAVKTLSGGTFYFSGNMFFSAIFMTVAAFIAFLYELGNAAGVEASTTAAFLTMALSQLLHVFNDRFGEKTILTRRLLTNWQLWLSAAATLLLILSSVYVGPLRTALHTAIPSQAEWTVILSASFLPLLLTEAYKLVYSGIAKRGMTQIQPNA